MDLIFKTSRGKSKLNPFLIKQQGLNQAEVNVIMSLHRQKDLLFDILEASGEQSLLSDIEEVEYKLQDAWKFTTARNLNYIKFWKIPGCQCPTMDNDDRWPFGYYVINESCKWHGSDLSKVVKD